MESQSLRTDDCVEKNIEAYANLVYRLAFARTGTKQDADDVFQEVFLRYLKKRPVFENQEHAKAWMIRVTINCSKTFLGAAWRKKTLPLEEGIVFETAEDTDLFHELQRLPAKYREVIHLFYYEDLSIAQISEILHRKSATIRTQLTRARHQLKIILEEEDNV